MPDPNSPLDQERAVADQAAARVVRRVLEQWKLILACVVLFGVGGFLFSSSRPDQYEATTTMQVGTIDLIRVSMEQGGSVNTADAERAAAAAVETFNLPDVQDRAAARLGGTVTPLELFKATRIETAAQSDVLRVTAKAETPKLAADISNTMAASFVTQRRVAARQKLLEAQRLVTRRYDSLSDEARASETGEILRGSLKQISALSALSDGNVEVVQMAREPSVPVAPSPPRDAVLALILGFLVGSGIALLRARFDDRIRDTDELTGIWDLPIVGLIPQTSGLRPRGRALPEAQALEAMSLARTNLRYLHVGQTVKTVLVTSAVAGEGKSTITWNLAIAAALARTRVLVIEADLRRPAISSRLGINGPGLSEVLAGLAGLEDTIQSVELDGEGRFRPEVDVLPAGQMPPSPVALLEGPEARAALVALRKQYDVILIDTPPATVVADAMAIVDAIDGVLVVSRLGNLGRTPFRRLRDTLTAVSAPVLGVVVNSNAAADKGYGGYYETSAASQPAWRRVAERVSPSRA